MTDGLENGKIRGVTSREDPHLSSLSGAFFPRSSRSAAVESGSLPLELFTVIGVMRARKSAMS